MKKNYKDLKFTDDFMFCSILERNPDLCKEITEVILGQKIKEIVKLDQQHAIRSTPDGRGVRFDVYFEDDENTIYDIEMQNASHKGIGKRSRYYQSMIDRRILDRSEPYFRLKKTYIIFICTFDPFGINLPKYTFESTCIESANLNLGDEAIKVFINAKGISKELTPEMKDFISYISSGEAVGPLSRRIEENLDAARLDSEMEVAYVTLQEMMDEARAEGHAEGLTEGRIETIKQILTKLTPSEVIDMGFSEEDIKLAQKEDRAES